MPKEKDGGIAVFRGLQSLSFASFDGSLGAGAELVCGKFLHKGVFCLFHCLAFGVSLGKQTGKCLCRFRSVFPGGNGRGKGVKRLGNALFFIGQGHGAHRVGIPERFIDLSARGAGGIGASLVQCLNSRRWAMVGSFVWGLMVLVLIIEFISTRIRRKLAHGA